ncbi:hypothetical protein [Helicobacter aurati]|uniref:hypothetical protein n=1 Tax=Helicobacter aurati TaxID=137778 RepID=UPI0011C02447|nr:hypothetical protein [Helicobacter aurati]
MLAIWILLAILIVSIIMVEWESYSNLRCNNSLYFHKSIIQSNQSGIATIKSSKNNECNLWLRILSSMLSLHSIEWNNGIKHAHFYLMVMKLRKDRLRTIA